MQRETAGLFFAIFLLAAANSSVAAQSNPSNPTFGSRADKPDGSVALTIGRRLPTDWDTNSESMPSFLPSRLPRWPTPR